MKMFKSVVVLVVGLGLSGPALAYENYIPLGAGYSPQVDTLPGFDTEAGQVSQQSDIYETELYLQQRKQAVDESRFRRFFSDAESTGADNSIDY